jgi:hypothetical protein
MLIDLTYSGVRNALAVRRIPLQAATRSSNTCMSQVSLRTSVVENACNITGWSSLEEVISHLVVQQHASGAAPFNLLIADLVKGIPRAVRWSSSNESAVLLLKVTSLSSGSK